MLYACRSHSVKTSFKKRDPLILGIHNSSRPSLDFSHRDVEGTVRLERYKENGTLHERHLCKPLLKASLAIINREESSDAFDFNPADANCSIKIASFRLKTLCQVCLSIHVGSFFFDPATRTLLNYAK